MKTFEDGALEPERYELRAEAPYHFNVARRSFFKVLGAGVCVVSVVREVVGQESGRNARRGGGGRRPQDVNAWVHIGEDGTVTLFSGKAEVGQNVRTMLTQVAAEELRVPVSSIRVVLADTQLTPFDAGTFGSRSTPDMVPQIRRASAAAREALVDLAAEQLKVDRKELRVENGSVKTDKASLTFGQISKGQKLLKTVGEEAPTSLPEKWSVAGTSVLKVDGARIVTGQHKYASDIKLPGMLHGRVLRPPAVGAKLKSIDASAAEAMPGVRVIHDGDFVGVAAPDAHTAVKALEAIKAEWTTSPQVGEAKLFEHLRGAKTEEPHEGITVADGAASLRTSYTVAYIAHAPLEPRAAVAEWKGDNLTIWAGTQRPFGYRGDLAQAFRIPEDSVRVIVPDTGSGYGGKHSGESAVEAARLAKGASKPVKLVWTREEEFAWAYFRPAGVIDVTAAANAEGKLTQWKFHNYNSGASGIRMLYDVPGAETNFHNAQSPLRQGSYRGLAATANHFARECAMDELAHASKMDPLEFRLKNAKDTRLRGVIEAVTKAFDWKNRRSTKTIGYGMAAGSEKGSYVATCVEVEIAPENGGVRVKHVVQAFECGAVLNPDHLKNQNEGAIMMGIGGALFEAIHFDEGKVLNPRFSEYRVPRFTDLPKIEIVLVNRKDLASAGAGETPIVGIAPAIANAIFAATGRRVRSMPLLKKGGLV